MVIGDFIIPVTLPEIPAENAMEYLQNEQKLDVTRFISRRNQEYTTGASENFFRGLPEQNEIEQGLFVKNAEANLHLAIAYQAEEIALIRLHGNQKSADKMAVFISLNEAVRRLLLQRTQTLLEEEYLKKFPAPKARSRIPEMAREKLKSFASPILSKLSRMHSSLLEIEEYFLNRQMTDLDILRKRALAKACEFYQLNPADLQTREARPATSPPDSKPVSQIARRRAVDSNRWQDYKKSHKQKPGSKSRAVVNWHHAFQKLGPFFTARIMLRKELFVELLQILPEQADWKYEDACQMAKDIKTTYQALEKQMAAQEKITALKQLERYMQSLLSKI